MNTNRKPVLGMILKGYPRISETFISNEILLLEKLGFSIHLISMRDPRENFTHKSVRDIRADVDYLPEPMLKGLPRFLYHNVMLALKIPREYGAALRVALRRFSRTRKSATFKHLLQAGHLVHGFLNGRGIVHLHAHFAHSPSSVALFASRLSGLPFSFTAHAKDIYTSNREQLKEKIALARFVATCTEFNKRYLTEVAENDATSIHRVYHGIDIDLFSSERKEEKSVDRDGKTGEPHQIFTVARIVAKKGLPTVYKALRCLRDQGVDFRHTLVGDGDDREDILSLIRELGLSDVCQWLGTQPHETVLEHFRRSDIFVLGCEVAKDGDRDGIPNVFVESMAMGVPVVGTRVSAIPELIEDGKSGLLAPPGQPEKLAEAMRRMLTDMELRKQVIRSARQRVVQEFDNKKLIRDLAEVYRREQPLFGD